MNVQTTLRISLYSLFRRQRLIVGLSTGVLATILLGSLLQRPSYRRPAVFLFVGARIRSHYFQGRDTKNHGRCC